MKIYRIFSSVKVSSSLLFCLKSWNVWGKFDWMFDIAEHISLARIPQWIQQGKLGSTTNRGNDLTFIFDLERDLRIFKLCGSQQTLWNTGRKLDNTHKNCAYRLNKKSFFQFSKVLSFVFCYMYSGRLNYNALFQNIP